MEKFAPQIEKNPAARVQSFALRVNGKKGGSNWILR
jgi:hypothetical protein